MDMSRMIFITGFARGGTSWLRDCVAAHPDVEKIPHEMVLFKDFNGSRDYVKNEITEAIQEIETEAQYYVNKAPANAPFIGKAARALPESKFIFIIRDPRDVFISHKRGTKKWMGGANKTVHGCMKKTRNYYKGWQDAEGLDNVLLVRYEDLHQNFKNTMISVFNHVGLTWSEDILQKIFNQSSFSAQTSRVNNQEQRDAAKRKGVIGDWGLYLEEEERAWYEKSGFWNEFLNKHSYQWRKNTFENILKAMLAADVHFLDEQDLLNLTLKPDRANIVVQHDIDYLNKPWCRESVLQAAEIEGENQVPAHYNFLPMDDPRYGKNGLKIVPDLIRRVKELNPLAAIGLHVNVCERFYPADVPCAGNNIDDLDNIISCLNDQINAYEKEGFVFHIATAHGYGRAKKLPNNRDTREIAEELSKRGIKLFDTQIRNKLKEYSTLFCALTDVGGVIKPKKIPGGIDLVDHRSYEKIPPGGFLRFLTHPGNYPVDLPSTIAMRVESFGQL
jgi:hypothetical protein